MEKIYKCYGRRFKLEFVRKHPDYLCPGCAFDGKERFCIKLRKDQTAQEKQMADNCSIGDLGHTAIYVDVTPWYLRLWNRIIGRK